METEALTDITENRDAETTAVNTENPETASEQTEATESRVNEIMTSRRDVIAQPRADEISRAKHNDEGEK